jgi:hypothetical protein
MIGDGFSVWSFIVSLPASSSITKRVPEPIYGSNAASLMQKVIDAAL